MLKLQEDGVRGEVMLWWHCQVVLQLREITCEGYCVGVQRHIAGDGHQKQLLVREVSEKECQSGLLMA